MKRLFGLTLMILGVGAILSSAGLLIHNHCLDYQAGQASARVLPRMEQVILDRQAEARDPAPNPTAPQEQALPVPTAPSRPLTLEMPRETIGGYDYVGVLSLPTLGRELPIMAELEMPWLQIAPCRYFGSTHTDDLVIAAHNYDLHFGPISDLLPGDPVYFTDMDGIVSIYEVSGTETLMPTDVDAVIGGEGDLILLTCTYGGGSRIAVRCDRVMLP